MILRVQEDLSQYDIDIFSLNKYFFNHLSILSLYLSIKVMASEYPFNTN